MSAVALQDHGERLGRPRRNVDQLDYVMEMIVEQILGDRHLAMIIHSPPAI